MKRKGFPGDRFRERPASRGLRRTDIMPAMSRDPRPAAIPPDDPGKPTLESTIPPLRIGNLGPGVVVGSYRLERELGRGAAGVVHAARHARTNALVALKVLPREGKGSAAERFAREVQALARLQHPNVVSIHEAGETATFRWYSMDLVEGHPLDHHLKGKPDAVAAVKLLLQVARGMEHAHARGLIHRDLKPSNILVTPDGIARVSDFGIAKHVDRATRLTEAGAMVGTLHYMSPEQCADSTALDGRSDVWAVGVMLFEAVTGQLPWHGETTILVITRICEEPLPRPRSLAPGLHPDLEAVIVRALEKDPSRRYPTMSALAADLERFVRGERVTAPRVRGGRRVLVALVAAALVVGGGGAFAAYRSAHPVASQESVRANVLERAEAIEKASALALAKGRAALAVNPTDARAIAVQALAERRAAWSALGGPGAASNDTAAVRARLEASPVRGALSVLAARAALAVGDARAARAFLEADTAPGGDLEGLLALGEARLLDDDATGADEAFSKAARAAPERWEPPLRLAETATRRGTREGVEELIAAARAKGAPPSAVEAARAERLVALGQTAEALDRLASALKTDPGSTALRLARTRALLLSNDEAAALLELRAAGQRDGLAVRLEARLHLASGAHGDAARALERLLRLAPGDTQVTLELAALQGALGDLGSAGAGLRAALARTGEAATGDTARLLAALVTVEVARGVDPAAFLQRLDTLAPDVAALLRARVAPADRTALEAAAGRATGPLRAALLAELAAVELSSNEPARARAHADEGLALDAGSRRAHLVRSALALRAGDAAEARSHHEAARAPLEAPPRLDAPELLALAEGRQDALVALDSLANVRRHQVEEERRPATPRIEVTGVSAPSLDLLERAARSLRYALALDPALTEARVLLGRVEAAIGRAEVAWTLALDAVSIDPASVAAGELLARLAKSSDAESVVERTRAALALASREEGARLRDALARLIELTGDVRRAAAYEEDAATAGPRVDRELLAHAADLLRRADDPRAAEVAARLVKEDQAVDDARSLAKTAEAFSARDRVQCGKLAKQALATEPFDFHVVNFCALSFRRIHRSFVERTDAPTAFAIDPTNDPIHESVVLALLDGRMAAEYLKHVYGLRSAYGQELVDDWRRRVAATRGLERTSVQLTLALVSATWDLYPSDHGSPYFAKLQRLPLAELHEQLAHLAADAPHCPSVYAARAIHFARAGQLASMRRDVERIRMHHQETPMDLWLASAIHVAIGDLEEAEALALVAARHPASDESTRRALLYDMPFAAIKDSPAWAKVAAAASR